MFTAPTEAQRPRSLPEWEARRKDVRAKLWDLLGVAPPDRPPRVTLESRSESPKWILERFSFDNEAGARVPGYIVLPPEPHRAPFPVALYCHAHGGKYDLGKEEIFLRTRPFKRRVQELLGLGCAVAVIDSYGFGERQGQGPDGQREKGVKEEFSLSKLNLWMGRTLWGMMLRDELMLLDYLGSRPDLDKSRIATMGMSMGSTKAWWLAALDERIKACISVCCLTRYQNLIAKGCLDRHNFYFFVPGILKHFDTESIVSLIAPRSFLALNGSEDEGSPTDGIKAIEEYIVSIYGLYGHPSRFKSIIYPRVGHSFTQDMWTESVRWLETHL